MLIAWPAAAETASIHAGMTLRDALVVLEVEHGLRSIFSTAVVSSSMRVERTPPALAPATLRDQLLAEHGLACTYAVDICVVRAGAAVRPRAGREPVPGQAATALDAVLVEAGRYRLGDTDSSYWSADTIAATPHLADDTFRLARNLPGVAASDYGAPFHVRGSQQDDVSVRLDGFELYRPFHLQNLLSAFSIVDSNLIGGVDFYTGVWPSRFSGRSGAVMDIRTRQPPEARQQRLGISAFNAFYGLADPSVGGEGSLLASARIGYLDFVLDYVDPEGDISPGFHDVFARYERPLGERQTVSLAVLSAGDDVLFEADDGSERSDGDSRADYFWARWQSEWDDGLMSETVIGHSRLDTTRQGFAVDPFESVAEVRDQRLLQSSRLTQRVEWVLPSGLLFDAGIEIKDERTEYDYRAVGEFFRVLSREPIILDRAFAGARDGFGTSAWLDVESALDDAWLLRAGGRVVRHEVDGVRDTHFDPTLSLAWLPSSDTVVRLAAATNTQGQRSDELGVEDGETAFYRAERSRQLVLGWEHSNTQGFTWRAEAYAKRWTDLRPRFQNLFEPVELFPETEGDRIRIQADRARAYGLELGVERSRESGRWWFRYAYSRAEERVDGQWFARSWDQPHAINTGLDFKFGQGWRLSAQAEAHSGWPTTEVLVGRDESGALQVALGTRNRKRFETYLNVSARLAKSVSVSSGTLTWYVEVFNALDRANPDMVVEFRLVEGSNGEPMLERELDGGLPIFPSFGVVWTF